MTKTNRYDAIIRWVFDQNHQPGRNRVEFRREEINEAARVLGIPTPKNLGDVVYSYRSRRALPEDIVRLAPAGKSWVILGTGPGAYAFVAKRPLVISPTQGLARTRIPNATPELVAMYSLSDEQAMLAQLRYNRLVDIFARVTCYPLQSHLRTTVRGVQLETDDLYVGIDRAGAHHVLPIQAKGERDRLAPSQIEQDIEMCTEKFPNLICRPIGAQFGDEGAIALFEFGKEGDEVVVLRERQYLLVPGSELTVEELARYGTRAGAAEDR